MQNQNFPLVDSKNLWLSCFNCYQDNYDFYYHESENAPMRGKYFMTCESCGMRTFFDFTETTQCKEH